MEFILSQILCKMSLEKRLSQTNKFNLPSLLFPSRFRDRTTQRRILKAEVENKRKQFHASQGYLDLIWSQIIHNFALNELFQGVTNPSKSCRTLVLKIWIWRPLTYIVLPDSSQIPKLVVAQQQVYTIKLLGNNTLWFWSPIVNKNLTVRLLKSHPVCSSEPF